METAIYNGELITASDVIDDIDLELKIRKASGTGHLYCPDENCPKPQLKFCHGEKNAEYFAHVNNCGCDYEKYDREITDQIRNMQRTLYNHFKNSGINIEIDKKILPNHYTHLSYKSNGQKLAIEIITQKKSAQDIDKLQNLYDANDINVCWVFLGDLNNNTTEKSMMFGKRYPVNYSKNNSCIVIDTTSNTLEQYRLDMQKYTEASMSDFSELYRETASLDDLLIENNIITLKDFNSRFQEWFDKKQSIYNDRIARHILTTEEQDTSKNLRTPTYEELLYNELFESQKNEYIQIKSKLYSYPELVMLYLEGSVPKERREYLASISKNRRNINYF